MKQFFKKQWPFLVHIAAIGIIFVTPSVQHFAEQHAAYSVAIAAAWGKLLHWAESPRTGTGSQF